MKVSSHRMSYPDNRDEWCMKFLFDNEKEFDTVKHWIDTNLDESFAGWKTDKTDLTLFLKTEKEYAFAILRWS